MGEEIFVVVLEDRHIDSVITLHRTRDSADRRVQEIISAYHRSLGSNAALWIDRDYAAASGWVRSLDTGHDDGPKIRIERRELLS